jgi:hypothetical protein
MSDISNDKTAGVQFINMNVFCAHDSDPREYLQSPHKIDCAGTQGVVASNGYLLVVIDNSAPESTAALQTPVSINEKLQGFVDALRKTVTARAWSDVDVSRIKLPDSVRCRQCLGEGTLWGKCSCCHRSEPEPCKKCGETGKGLQSINVNGLAFNVEYLRQIAKLPGAVLLHASAINHDYSKPCWFEFLGGFGWIMPLRKDATYETHHADFEINP